MPFQKYRADIAKSQPDGATIWQSQWLGGPTIAKITNCRLANLSGDMRRVVYAVGDPDAWSTIPAITQIMGCQVTGYITGDDSGNLVFRQTYY